MSGNLSWFKERVLRFNLMRESEGIALRETLKNFGCASTKGAVTGHVFWKGRRYYGRSLVWEPVLAFDRVCSLIGTGPCLELLVVKKVVYRRNGAYRVVAQLAIPCSNTCIEDRIG